MKNDNIELMILLAVLGQRGKYELLDTQPNLYVKTVEVNKFSC